MQGNKQLDLGGFTLYDSNAIEGTGKEIQQKILERTIQNVQYVFNQIIEAKKQEISAKESLPEQEQIHDFNVTKLFMKLPQPGMMLPRSRRVPQEKPPTKWQKFAKQKGIKKQKRTGLTYDGTQKQYVARWGGRSGKNKFEPAIMEQKQPGRNPFEDVKNNKKLRVEKQRLKHIKNQDRSNM